jgi:hypothetical protein
MGEKCSTHGEDEKCIQNFSEKREREKPLVKPRNIWTIILKWILEK